MVGISKKETLSRFTHRNRLLYSKIDIRPQSMIRRSKKETKSNQFTARISRFVVTSMCARYDAVSFLCTNDTVGKARALVRNLE